MTATAGPPVTRDTFATSLRALPYLTATPAELAAYETEAATSRLAAEVAASARAWSSHGNGIIDGCWAELGVSLKDRVRLLDELQPLAETEHAVTTACTDEELLSATGQEWDGPDWWARHRQAVDTATADLMHHCADVVRGLIA